MADCNGTERTAVVVVPEVSVLRTAAVAVTEAVVWDANWFLPVPALKDLIVFAFMTFLHKYDEVEGELQCPVSGR